MTWQARIAKDAERDQTTMVTSTNHGFKVVTMFWRREASDPTRPKEAPRKRPSKQSGPAPLEAS